MSLRSAVVTGGSGFIGGALARTLAARGVAVCCPVRRASPGAARLREVAGVSVVELASMGEDALAPVLARAGAEVVFHLAAYGVKPDERDVLAMIDGNVGLTSRLLLAAAAQETPPRLFVHAGSCAEFASPEGSERRTASPEGSERRTASPEGSERRTASPEGSERRAASPEGSEPLADDAPRRAASLYGAAKAAASDYGRAVAASLGLRFVTLRLFGVYGPGEAPSRLIPYLIDTLERDARAALTPGEQVRDVTYVDDVVDAFVRIAERDEPPRHADYNVCSQRPVRVREVGEAVAAALGRPASQLDWGARPYRPDEPRWLVGDRRRFSEETGWEPRVDLAEGVARMVRDARDGARSGR